METADDPFLWLEDIEGEKALDWVRARNAETLTVLQADPRYAMLHDQALAIVHAKDRVPWGSIGKNDRVSSFWQDETNVRGLWRRTTLESYRTAEPSWATVLDFDELARVEGRNWIYKGGTSLRDSFDYVCINLSDGGKDACEFREFNPETRTFDPEGFNGPEGKHRMAWLDRDTLLIAPDLGEGTLTKSGYPFTVRKWISRAKPRRCGRDLPRHRRRYVRGFRAAMFVRFRAAGHIVVSKPELLRQRDLHPDR